MTTITFDRLTCLGTLKAAGIPEARLCAHAVAFDEALRDSVAAKADVVKWLVGVAFAQGVLLLALLRLFPGGHP